jgi:hypothetical protein
MVFSSGGVEDGSGDGGPLLFAYHYVYLVVNNKQPIPCLCGYGFAAIIQVS